MAHLIIIPIAHGFVLNCPASRRLRCPAKSNIGRIKEQLVLGSAEGAFLDLPTMVREYCQTV